MRRGVSRSDDLGDAVSRGEEQAICRKEGLRQCFLAGCGIPIRSNLRNDAVRELEYSLAEEWKVGYAVVHKCNHAGVVDHWLGGKHDVTGGGDDSVRQQERNPSLRKQEEPAILGGSAFENNISPGVDRG